MASIKIPSTNEICKVVETYKVATTVNCLAFNEKGSFISGSLTENCPSICKIVQQYDSSHSCKKSYIYGGQQADKIGEAYIYFCPYGLVKWTVTVPASGETKYFLTGGPVLLHKVDELLIEEIVRQNPKLISGSKHIRTALHELEIVDPVRVNHLAELLMLTAKSLTIVDRALDSKIETATVNANVARVIQNLKKEVYTHKIGGGEGKPYPFEKEKELITKVRLGDKQGAKEILNDILGHIFFFNKFEQVKLMAMNLMVVLTRTALEVGADSEIIFGTEHVQIRRIIDVTDIHELPVEILRTVDWFMECTFPVINIKNRHMIFRAMNYIRENYSTTCLDDVAREVGLNPAYFSKLFKEETGGSYSEYLNKVKIEASKDLLQKDYTLAQIAQMVGFNDQSYFTQIFKKHEGLSPNKWRKSKGNT